MSLSCTSFFEASRKVCPHDTPALVQLVCHSRVDPPQKVYTAFPVCSPTKKVVKPNCNLYVFQQLASQAFHLTIAPGVFSFGRHTSSSNSRYLDTQRHQLASFLIQKLYHSQQYLHQIRSSVHLCRIAGRWFLSKESTQITVTSATVSDNIFNTVDEFDSESSI